MINSPPLYTAAEFTVKLWWSFSTNIATIRQLALTQILGDGGQLPNPNQCNSTLTSLTKVRLTQGGHRWELHNTQASSLYHICKEKQVNLSYLACNDKR